MSVFNHYARYYDLLYRDKDYAGEARFVHEQLGKHGAAAGRLLELGCGTGRHAVEFAKLGWSVDGVDLSQAMVAQAQERARQQPPEIISRLQFQQGDVRSADTGQVYDAAISLFHVMSYQTTNADLTAAFATAARHLRPGGLFLFDFWYGPAVLTNRPTVRIKRIEDEYITVTRLAEPELCPNRNEVTVNYQVFVRDKATEEYSEVKESHKIRYLFMPELEFLLSRCGLTVVRSSSWCSEEPLSDGTWYGCLVSQKIA